MAIDKTIPELDTLQESATTFRDLINESRFHHSLFKQRAKFDLVCSAMDIIDDILFALHSYAQNDHRDQGLAYLEIFGVLQALSVQQDAVSALHKLITGVPMNLEKTYTDIQAVRDTRVRVAGHPVGGRGSSHFLVRYTVSKWGFELWKFDQAGVRTTEHVSLLNLMKKNCLSLTTAMNDLIRWIEAESKKHKEKFVGESLSDLLKLSSYFCEKMHDGVSRERTLGLVGVQCIREMINKFREALNGRGDHFKEADFVTYDIVNLEYAVAKFERYMRGDEPYNEKDAVIVVTFVRHELDRLKEIAKDIDADYRI